MQINNALMIAIIEFIYIQITNKDAHQIIHVQEYIINNNNPCNFIMKQQIIVKINVIKIK